MLSRINEIGEVCFPVFTGERLYQVPFKKEVPLPVELSRWQPTVDAMLQGIDTEEEMYLMVDQGEVGEGSTQRREGAHIDGNWIVGENAHTTGHQVMMWDTGGGRWNTKNLETGGIILAADRDGATVYEGTVDGVVGEGGDCSHLDLSNTKQRMLEPNKAYLGNVTMIHESMPSKKSGKRTLVRITLPQTYAA